MLQCPRCSNPLSVTECCAGCLRPVATGHITNPMGRDLLSMGVIQYPSTAILQNPPTNHEYQNTVKTSPEIGSQNPQNAQHQNSSGLPIEATTPGLGPTRAATFASASGSEPLLSSDYAMNHSLTSNDMMLPTNNSLFFQQAKQNELINLQIKMLQNQLQLQQAATAVIQQEIIKTQSHAVSPCQLMTASVAPQTPAILIAANHQPFFPNQLNGTINGTNSCSQTTFTPPPDIPLRRALPDFTEVWRISQEELEQCCWYYGSLTWQESSILLQDTAEGTFLVRDSQDRRFLYSLSVQRSKEGPTSVRIHFSNGKFSLDAEERIRDLMPTFNSVGELIEHYVSLGEKHLNSKEVLIDQKIEDQKIHTPIVLRQPRFKKPPTLAHFTRIAINRSMATKKMRAQAAATFQPLSTKSDNIKSLKLPPKLNEFLRNYPLRI